MLEDRSNILAKVSDFVEILKIVYLIREGQVSLR